MPRKKSLSIEPKPLIIPLATPKDFSAVRELARQIACRPLVDSQGNPVLIFGREISVIEAILTDWSASRIPALQRAFVEYAFGQPPEEPKIVSVTTDLKAYVTISPDDWDGIIDGNATDKNDG